MSDWPECDAALQASQASGDPWGYCTQVHCDEVSNYNHQFCSCTGQFSRLIKNGVCPNGAGDLIPNANPGCYCCCSCFAYDTPIAESQTHYKAVQDFIIGDPLWVAEDATLTKWTQKPVRFSSGTGAHGKNRLIKILFGNQTKGQTLNPDSFQSQFITEAQSADYFAILSTPPNNFIDADGTVNLVPVRNANVDVIAKLLNIPMIAAQRVYDILNFDGNYLLVTSIQPFLMSDKTLKQAHKLVPGKDMLVREDGTITPIVSMEVGMFEKGVHHIATSDRPATSLDGHLMVANGIVVGDYSLQLSLASGLLGSDMNSNLPSFGTKEYNDLHTHLEATPFSARPATLEVVHKVEHFEAFHPIRSMYIPTTAFSFITKAQANQLMQNAPIFPASKNVAESDVNYLFKLFGAFYPEIRFCYDQNNMTPNVYSFEQYGEKIVVVTAGWTSIQGVYFQAIGMAVAHVVNALLQVGSVPAGISPVGQADYDIYAVFLSLFYRAPDAVKNYNLGLDQIKTVFGYIKRYRKTVGKIGLNCRIKTLENSINGLALPHCAGGPPDPALELVSASAETVTGQENPVITVTFNLEVDPQSAIGAGNYMMDPRAAIVSIQMNPSDKKQVLIQADITAETEYLIVATGVLSVDLHPMIIGKNSAQFTLTSNK